MAEAVPGRRREADMTGTEILVTASGLALLAGLAWFFFGPREARRAVIRGGVQEIQITVKGGYSPNLIRVQQCHQRFVAAPEQHAT